MVATSSKGSTQIGGRRRLASATLGRRDHKDARGACQSRHAAARASPIGAVLGRGGIVALHLLDSDPQRPPADPRRGELATLEQAVHGGRVDAPAEGDLGDAEVELAGYGQRRAAACSHLRQIVRPAVSS